MTVVVLARMVGEVEGDVISLFDAPFEFTVLERSRFYYLDAAGVAGDWTQLTDGTHRLDMGPIVARQPNQRQSDINRRHVRTLTWDAKQADYQSSVQHLATVRGIESWPPVPGRSLEDDDNWAVVREDGTSATRNDEAARYPPTKNLPGEAAARATAQAHLAQFNAADDTLQSKAAQLPMRFTISDVVPV